jgi:HEAT repeat protein
MDIHFCDLCNESVPQSDLDQGRAFLRRGRVVCASCERAMTHTAGSPPHGGGIGAGPTADEPGPAVEVEIAQAIDVLSGDPRVEPSSIHAVTPPDLAGAPESPAPFPSPAPVAAQAAPWAAGPPPPRRSAGVVVGIVALLFAAGAVAVLNESIRGNEAKSAELASKMRAQDVQIDELRKANATANAELGDLRGKLSSELASERDVAEKAIADLKAENGDLKKSNEDLAHRLDEASASAVAREQVASRMHEELATTVAKSKDDGKAIEDRLAKLEEAVQKTPAPAPAAPAAADNGSSRLGPLLADLQSPKAAARWEAVDQIGQLKDPEAVPYLLPLLKDVDVFVRMATARVLGDLKATAAVPALIDALEDTEAAVREAALGALRSLTGKDLRFDPMASEAERSKKVKAWRDWWKKVEEEGGLPKPQGSL